VLGQNDALAWGFTNTGPDVQDLYLEQVDPQRPDHVRTPDGWARMEAAEETIRVRGGREVPVTVRRTRHGPVISDAGAGKGLLGDGRSDGRPAYLLAMRWTALDADADPVGAGLAMMAARDVEGFVNASSRWVAPMQNMVVADRAGRIGFVAAGRVPLRRADNDLHGMFPAPGWEARYDWAGWIGADATPREFDPARGWLATANQRIHDDSYPHPISTDWAPPWRQQRIEAMLQVRERHSLDDLARMQADVQSLAAVQLLPWMRDARPDHTTAAAVQAILAGWDGAMDAAQPAPLIHWAWIRQLTRLLIADELGGDAGLAAVFPQRSFREAVEGILVRQDGWWCDDKSTPTVTETCTQVNDRAMAAALHELSTAFGPDLAAWRWGDAHQAVSEHRPFSQVKALAPWFELRTPVGGDTYTVNVSRVALKGADPGSAYQSTHGPSLRALYDVAERQRSRVMHSSGQSGLPWLSAYRAFVEPWRRVDYLPLWPEGPEAAAGGVLTLAPRAR
jgi:penicillin amidase